MPELRGIALRLLRALEGTDAAAGDVLEDLDRRTAEGRGPRFPRAWLALRLWMAVADAAGLAGRRTLRACRTVVRDALRALRAAPGTTAFALAILTVAIAAATVTFSVVDAVVLRSLPFDDDDRLVVVGPGTDEGPGITSAVEFMAWRDRADAFAALAATAGTRVEVSFGSETEVIEGLRATASLFDVLRVRAVLGRVFSVEHEVAGRNLVAVIGHDLWQRRFDGDPGVIGRSIRRGDDLLEIIGVTPEGFTYPVEREVPVQIWVPYVVPDGERDLTRGITSYLRVIGRLEDEATTESARAQVAGISASSIDWGRFGGSQPAPVVTTLYDTLVGDVRGWMLLVLWAVALVMLVACVNVAHLLLARANVRARELAIRVSLGASRRQVAAGLLVESLALSLTAAALGVTASFWGIGLAKAALPDGIARAGDIALDVRVLTATVLAAAAAAVLFGLVPAWSASRASVAPLLKDSAPAATPARRRWRAGLVAAEVAFVGLLLVVSTLFVSSFIRIVTADLGFDRSDLVTFTLRGFQGDRAEVVEQLRQIPGVRLAASFSGGSPPLVATAFGEGGLVGASLQASGQDASEVFVNVWVVSPEYFDTAGMTFVHGRGFDVGIQDAGVVVIDERAAAELFPDGRHPVGAPLRRHDETTLTVVGVVRPVSLRGPEQASLPQAYLPGPERQGAPQFLVRSDHDAHVIPSISRLASDLMPAGAPAPAIRRFDEAYRVITSTRRFTASVMSIFGLIAMLIGAAGVYAVVASAVAQDRRGLGIRVALGATRRQIVRGVLRRAGSPLVAGLLAGLLAGRAFSELFASLLFDVQPGDAHVYAVVAVLLLGVGLAAALIPARRAARVDPLATLRGD